MVTKQGEKQKMLGIFGQSFDHSKAPKLPRSFLDNCTVGMGGLKMDKTDAAVPEACDVLGGAHGKE